MVFVIIGCAHYQFRNSQLKTHPCLPCFVTQELVIVSNTSRFLACTTCALLGYWLLEESRKRQELLFLFLMFLVPSWADGMATWNTAARCGFSAKWQETQWYTWSSFTGTPAVFCHPAPACSLQQCSLLSSGPQPHLFKKEWISAWPSGAPTDFSLPVTSPSAEFVVPPYPTAPTFFSVFCSPY